MFAIKKSAHVALVLAMLVPLSFQTPTCPSCPSSDKVGQPLVRWKPLVSESELFCAYGSNKNACGYYVNNGQTKLISNDDDGNCPVRAIDCP